MTDPHHNALAALAGSGSMSIPAPHRSIFRLLLPITLLAALALMFLYVARDRIWPAPTVHVVQVVPGSGLAGTTVRPAAVAVQAPGWVEPAPFPVYATALASGVVRELLVLEGDVVAQNQIVAQLVDDDAKLALERAKAILVGRRAELAAAVSNWENPVELDRMIAVADARCREIEASQLELQDDIRQADAELAEAKNTSTRFSGLPEGTVPVLEVERAQHQLAARQAALAAVTRHADVLAASLLREQADLAAARKNRELRIAQKLAVAQAEAEVAEAETAAALAELNLARMTIRAPVAGVVMNRLVAPGSKLMLAMDHPDSAHVVHLYNPAQLQIRVDVPLAEAARVGVGQEAIIVVDVLPSTSFSGRVTRFVHTADIGKNTVQVKVEMTAPSPLLKPDMLARVKFLAAAAPAEATAGGAGPVLMPAAAAAERTGDQVAVWRITPAGNRVERVLITAGNDRGDGWIEVAEGLNPGDALVTQPPANLVDGARVRPIDNSPGGS